MSSAIVTILLGAVGWLVANLLGKPLVDLLTLRAQIHEELIFIGNLLGDEERNPQIEAAETSLRRYGAKLHSFRITAPILMRWALWIWILDLELAGRGLIGFSNLLQTGDGSLVLCRDMIEAGLDLPRTYSRTTVRAAARRVAELQ